MWRCKVPPKFKVHMWLLIMERLNTKIHLSRFFDSMPTNCILCSSPDATESFRHLFFQCRFAIEVWHISASIIIPSTRFFFDSFRDFWDCNSGIGPRRHNRLELAVFAFGWEIWAERNRRCFKNNSKGPMAVAYDIIANISFWTGTAAPPLRRRIRSDSDDDDSH